MEEDFIGTNKFMSMFKLPASGIILCLALMPIHRIGARNIEGSEVLLIELKHSDGSLRPIIIPEDTEDDAIMDGQFIINTLES